MRDVVAINRKGEIEDHQRAILKDIEGIVLLDGTWSQAKALWWRNAWMLKCQRIILGPKRPSRYGKLRREPRRDGLSTIEAAAMLLASLEKRPDIAETLHAQFRADARRISRGASHAAGTRAETAAEAGLSPPQAGLTRALPWLPIRRRPYKSSPPWGHVAEWLRNGLQNRVHQFNSGRGLQSHLIDFSALFGYDAGCVPAGGRGRSRDFGGSFFHLRALVHRQAGGATLVPFEGHNLGLRRLDRRTGDCTMALAVI